MALAKCYECGQDVSTQAKACPACGAPVKKRSGARLGLFLLAVLGLFGLLALAIREPAVRDQPGQSPPPVPAPTGPEPPKAVSPAEPPRPLKADVMRTVDFTMRWEKGGFGTVLVADITLTNKSAHPVKDVELFCGIWAESGTELGRLRHTIYEAFAPKKTKTVRQINMGFIHSQAHTVGCVLSDLVVMPAPAPRRK
jgi:hypothetical protein